MLGYGAPLAMGVKIYPGVNVHLTQPAGPPGVLFPAACGEIVGFSRESLSAVAIAAKATPTT